MKRKCGFLRSLSKGIEGTHTFSISICPARRSSLRMNPSAPRRHSNKQGQSYFTPTQFLPQVGSVLRVIATVLRTDCEPLRARVSVCVDDAANAGDLDDAARAAGVRLDVLIEMDVGAHRCGVEPGEPALRLARVVNEFGNLRFAGIHAYHGSAQHLRSIEERRAAIAQAVEQARRTRDLIEDEGLDCETVTGAGTGSFLFEQASGVYTELQPGSYVFMDADYGRNAWDGFPRFAQSLHIWTTVMSAPAAGRAVVDAGLKAHSVDSGMPLVLGWVGVEYAKASDEHGVLKVAAGVRAPTLGEKLRLVPGHCDPTVNLYDWLVCVRGERVEALWPITARGAFY